jgi:hypothetical protein
VKLKLTKDGHAVVKNGHPVYVHDDGSEEAFDAPAAMKLARGQAFAASKYVAEKLNIHHELAAAFFGDALRLEKGQLVAYGAGGVPLYSHRRPGELANLDEAVEQLVAKYPSKAMILREGGAAGATAPATHAGTGTTITRPQFDALPQDSRAKFLKDGGRIGDAARAAAPTAPASSQQRDGKTLTRAIFESLPPIERMTHVRAGGSVVD